MVVDFKSSGSRGVFDLVTQPDGRVRSKHRNTYWFVFLSRCHRSKPSLPCRHSLCRLGDQLPQYIRKYTAMEVVLDLDRRVDAQGHGDFLRLAVRLMNDEGDVLATG